MNFGILINKNILCNKYQNYNKITISTRVDPRAAESYIYDESMRFILLVQYTLSNFTKVLLLGKNTPLYHKHHAINIPNSSMKPESNLVSASESLHAHRSANLEQILRLIVNWYC